MSLAFLRTPDQRFSNLPDFPFEPHYANVDAGGATLRMHYLDEGPANARPVLFLHGEPTWSYLYRKMLPHFTAAGYRSIAPDLIGFGRSDKPVRRDDYTYARHVGWLRSCIEALDLRDVIMVGQDWGGLIGLRLLAETPERFSGAVLANTGLPTGDEHWSEAFDAWRASSQRAPEFLAGVVLARTCTPKLTPAVAAAYDAPFPDQSYVAGARQFPLLVPTRPDDPASEANRAAWRALQTFEKPLFCAFSDGDPITRGTERRFIDEVPGARGVAHVTIHGASHFLQEDRPDEFAEAILTFLASASLGSHPTAH